MTLTEFFAYVVRREHDIVNVMINKKALPLAPIIRLASNKNSVYGDLHVKNGGIETYNSSGWRNVRKVSW